VRLVSAPGARPITLGEVEAVLRGDANG
jgi:hypothetical protein